MRGTTVCMMVWIHILPILSSGDEEDSNSDVVIVGGNIYFSFLYGGPLNTPRNYVPPNQFFE